TYLIERRFHKNKTVQVFLLLAVAVTVTLATVSIIRAQVEAGCADMRANASTCSSGDVLAAFVAFLIIWCAVFHFVAWRFGRTFSSTPFGKNWVKSIDYVYLTLSVLGIL